VLRSDPAPEKKQSQRPGILRAEFGSQAAGGPRSTGLKQHGRETYQSALSLNHHTQVIESILILNHWSPSGDKTRRHQVSSSKLAHTGIFHLHHITKPTVTSIHTVVAFPV